MRKSKRRFRCRDTLVFVRVVINKVGEPDADHPDHICARHTDSGMIVLDSPVGLSVFIPTSDPEPTPVFHYDKRTLDVQLYEPGPWEHALRLLARGVTA